MIEVVFDDILKQDVDAIVNPANQYMLHGGGLAATIIHTAGPVILQESQDKAPVDTGESISTGAGKLPFKAIIHTVGPYWEGEDDDPQPYWRQNSSDEDPDLLLAQAHKSAMREAHEVGAESLAFPAVSCGVFRFPVQRAAPIAIQAVSEAQKEYPVRAVFCLLDDDHYTAFERALKEHLS